MDVYQLIVRQHRIKERSFLRNMVLISMTTLSFLANEGNAQNFGCVEDRIRNNSNGEILVMNSGRVFETLGVGAYLWLGMSPVIVCGPISFTYSGKTSSYFRIINTRSDSGVNAWMLSGYRIPRGSCYQSSIRRPSPFMGNRGEVFILHDGTAWEVGLEYNYMYEYFPTIIACPEQGYVIVEEKRLSARMVES